MLRRTKILLLAIAIVGATGLAGCADSKGAGGAPAKVRIGVFAGNTLIDVTQFAALNSGALQRAGDQQGFEVETVVAGNGQELVAGLLGGSIDFAILPSPASLGVNSKRREVALRTVLNTFEGGVLVFVGAKKYESERGQDLRAYNGGTWGYSKEGQQSYTLAQVIADKIGIGWKNQHGIALGDVTAYVPALPSGRADLIVTDAAGAALAIERGAGYVIHNTNGSDEYFSYSRACHGLTTTSAFAKSRPDVVKAVVGAEREALEQLKAAGTNSQTVLDLMPPDFRKANEGHFGKAWELFAPAFKDTTGAFTPECIADAIAFAKAQGIENPDPATFDDSFTKS